MALGERVFIYCERGTDPAYWAEPINAITNAGFILAALIFWQCLLWRKPEERNPDHYLLMTLVFLIGIGSFAFHTHADQGTALADVIPITLFMLVYLGFALNRFLSVPPGWTVLLVIVFTGVMYAAGLVHCWDGGIGLKGTVEDSKTCLNGSMRYLPALVALIIVGMLTAERHHKAAPYILWAAVTFTVSIVFRTIDFGMCDTVVIEGRNVGTHFLWHLLNAVVLFLLLRATLETQSGAAPVETEGEPAPAAAGAVAAKPAVEASDREEPKFTASEKNTDAESAASEATSDAAKPEDPKPEEPTSDADESKIGESPGDEDAPKAPDDDADTVQTDAPEDAIKAGGDATEDAGPEETEPKDASPEDAEPAAEADEKAGDKPGRSRKKPSFPA